MRRLTLTLLATTATIGLAASVASAADLPRKAPAPVLPPPPPPYNWTGFFIGGNLGAGWARNQFTDLGCSTAPNEGIKTDLCTEIFSGGRDGTAGILGSHNALGIVGGVQVGYNWQFPNSPWVIGIEGTYRGADLKGDHQNSVTVRGNADSLFQGQERIFSKTNGIATIVGKLGLASGPQDRTLWYVVGGGAWRRTKLASVGNWVEFDCCHTIRLSDRANATFAGTNNRWGWTVGTGVEFGLWDNWTTRIQYDYLDFGNKSVNFNGVVCNPTSCQGVARQVNLKQQIHLVTIGLSYRWNWWR